MKMGTVFGYRARGTFTCSRTAAPDSSDGWKMAMTIRVGHFASGGPCAIPMVGGRNRPPTNSRTPTGRTGVLRGCLKTDLSCSWREDCRASKVAFHEQAELSKRPERPTMAATRTTAASSQTGRPTNQVPASGGDERYSLCVAYRVRVADASSRPASLAHHIPLLSHLAARWDLGEDS